MKFGKLMAGAILAVSAVAANAADKETDKIIDLTEGTAGFTNTYSFAGAAGKSFLDTYSFFLTSSVDLDSSLTSIAKNTKSKFNLDITSFNLYLGDTLVAAGVEEESGDLESWYLTGANLSSGAYSLKVGGVFEGTNGGTYSGDINVSPVPEPATWGMLGLGLAAVGFAARRKQAK